MTRTEKTSNTRSKPKRASDVDKERWLDETILETESRIDNNTVNEKWLRDVEKQFDKLSNQWAKKQHPSQYKLLELGALLAKIYNQPAQATEHLNNAYRIMPEGKNFVSDSARRWLSNQYQKVNDPGQPETRKKPNKRKTLALLLAGAVIIALVIAVPRISDYYTLKNADPTMAKLAADAGMTRKGELLFLKADPQLVTDSDLISDCSSVLTNNTGYVVFGCYVPNQNDPTSGHIFLRQMSTDLYNEEVVTAAYEMLHVAYEDLISNSGTAKALNQEIESNYSLNSDSNVSSSVDEFAKTEPGARDLELFSLLGTQTFQNLDSTLQNYYYPYITAPGLLVADNNQINSLFSNDENQLQQLQTTIKNDDNLANTAYQDSVEWAYAGNQYEDDYNYNIYLRDLNAENSAIDQYNSLLQTYQVLVGEFNGQQFSPIQNINTKSQ